MSCPHCQKRERELAEARKAAAASACGCADAARERREARERLALWISFASLVASFCVARFFPGFPGFPLADPAWIAVALCGAPILRAAADALFRGRRITSSLLISSGIAASIALQIFSTYSGAAGTHEHESYIFAAGEIAFLMGLGEWLEARTLRRTRDGVEALLKVSPKRAVRVRADGSEESVPVEELAVGDVVAVRSDETIPADGEVISGSSAVDQSSLTGESVPADKLPGDSVLAGTRNLSGSLRVRVSRRTGDTAIARLVRLVEEAESKKAPIQNVADRWASKVVPAALVFSVLVFAAAFFLLDAGFEASLVRGVTILVVFCPCAFALATPTAIAAGIGNASRRGVLVKSGAALELLAATDTAVFDKTGTLTRSSLRVEGVFAAAGFSEARVLALCGAAERHSAHPIARALVAACGNAPLPEATEARTRNGVGIECVVEGARVSVRSRRAAAADTRIPPEAEAFADARAARGETLVALTADDAFAGFVALSDTLREGAPELVRELKAAGVRTIVLTGDNREAAARVAESVGADEAISECLPEDKAAAIRGLRERGARSVLMVGDGVNDAPALASADSSIAMGALGSELAVETAEIALLNDRVELVPALIRFSRTVLRTIHANFAFSICVNVSAVALSAFGVLDPVSGAVVHNASSLLVVLNSASLMTRKLDRGGPLCALRGDGKAG